jgi:hypothetical protein
MTRNPVPSSKEALIERIRAVISETGQPFLSRSAFLERSGLSQWAIDKYFDSWGDACQAAGITTAPTVAETPTEQSFTDDQCLAELRRVADLRKTSALSSKQYGRYGRISASTVARRFGGWAGALAAGGLSRSAHAERLRLATPEECVEELRRVAAGLGRRYLTAREFTRLGRLSAVRVVRVFRSWHAALQAAGLEPSPNFKREVPLSTLAGDFLRAAIDLARVPSLVQLTRRSQHVSHTFSGRHGGYNEFKRRAIEHLFSRHAKMPPAIREMLEAEAVRVARDNTRSEEPPRASPHRQGRTLGFRAFAFAPTTEHDVVQLFGAVAAELGFEILGNRSSFPDCEARRLCPGGRENFVPCLIEYEFASSEFRRHKHPPGGCDLVVCWMHDWPDCPVEVLELKTEITRLPGWK